jgi:membrane-bound lytic murein transglycosylase D
MRFSYKWIIVFCCLLGMCRFAVAFPSAEGIQEYRHDLHLFPDRKQVLADDINRYHNAEDLWEVLRQEFSLQHYENDPQVQAQIEWFMLHQDFLLRSATRASPYLYFILQQARKRHLPIEVVLLPIIESAYNPYAYSSAGASGIWQMMPGTASDHGIKFDTWYDGRRDVIASTQAALNFLGYLGNFFNNNWLLAFAAYDTGVGNVSAAINRNIRDGYDTDFWSLRLAQETRIYVPRLLALAAIIANPERYPVYLPPIHNAPYLAQMDIGTQIELKHAASLAGMPVKQLMDLNSGFKRSATDPNGKHKLVLPIENVAQFTENLLQSPVYQRIGKGTLGDATLAELENNETTSTRLANQDVLTTNDIMKNARVITTDTQSNSFFNKQYTSAKSAASLPLRALQAMPHFASSYSIQPGDTVYMTRPGDDLDKIAAHFHVTRAALLASNPVDTTRGLRPDQRLVVPTHLINTQVAKITPAPRHYRLASGDTIYMVRQGDTIDAIAKRYRLKPAEIRIANLIADNDVHTGDRLIIPNHA